MFGNFIFIPLEVSCIRRKTDVPNGTVLCKQSSAALGPPSAGGGGGGGGGGTAPKLAHDDDAAGATAFCLSAGRSSARRSLFQSDQYLVPKLEFINGVQTRCIAM